MDQQQLRFPLHLKKTEKTGEHRNITWTAYWVLPLPDVNKTTAPDDIASLSMPSLLLPTSLLLFSIVIAANCWVIVYLFVSESSVKCVPQFWSLFSTALFACAISAVLLDTSRWSGVITPVPVAEMPHSIFI